MHAAKARKRLAALPPEYPTTPPLGAPLKRITVEDFRLGTKHEITPYPSARRKDQFRVTVDGKAWKQSIGYSRLLAGIRKAR